MAGKQLSRITSRDRVLTVNDLFDPNERPQGAVMALKETKNLVDHSTQAHIFATKAELDTFVAEQSALSEAERTVKVGDNLYITDTGVPDYWWTGVEGQWISELDVGRVDVTVEQELNESRNPVSSNAVKGAVANMVKYVDGDTKVGDAHGKWVMASTNGQAGGFVALGNANAFPTCTDHTARFTHESIVAYGGTNGQPETYYFGTGCGNQIARKKDLEGLGGGGFDPAVSDIAIGLNACVCGEGSKAIVIGENAWAYGSGLDFNGGVAIGRCTSAGALSVAIGGGVCSNSAGAHADDSSVAVGGYAGAGPYSVAVGKTACAGHLSVAVGSSAVATDAGVAVGQGAKAARASVAIGEGAGADSSGNCIGVSTVMIGPMAENHRTADGDNTKFYPIVIGTSCRGVGGDKLAAATIRVDTEGNLTVGGKPVGGGGDSAVEVWKGNVGFGEQDTFIGAKKTADGDGQFLKGYPRLHNHGQDIHEVSGFSRDSYENECVWSHRFIIPWDLAKANDTSYMAANVKWQGNRNLLQTGDETTFVQPLMPVNTGNTSSVFPYAIPAFEESPVYWSGTIIYNNTQNADGSYSDNAKMVSVPWEATCSADTAWGGYSFLLYRKGMQPTCQIADGVKVAVAFRDGGGGEIDLASQAYVKTLEARIQTLETKLAAVGA